MDTNLNRLLEVNYVKNLKYVTVFTFALSAS